MDRILADDYFNLDKDKLMSIIDPKNFIGFAPRQTEEFIKFEIEPVLSKYKDRLGMNASLRV